MITIIPGDNLAALRRMGDATVDAVVCDPPYGLGVPPDPVDMLTAWLAGGHLDVRGAGFMGNTWDAFVPQPALWREVWRVLKPGAHVLAFFGSRTVDVGALALRLAGFEIRDQVAWVYGSGFAKSLDVSKAIDKRRVEDVEPTRVVCRAVRAAMDRVGVLSRHLAPHFEGCHPRLIDHWAARDTDSQPSLPTPDQWAKLKVLLPIGDEHDAEFERLSSRKGEFGSDWHAREVTGEQAEWRNRVAFAMTSLDGKRRDAPAGEEARRWAGWGTALKPAFEPIVMARKPLPKTVADCVLEHGTGALNIGACKLDAGRWPANLAHDESPEVMALFPDTRSGKPGIMRGGVNTGSSYGAESRAPGTPMTGYGDAGSAARFFYSAKAGPADRAGSPHPTVKPVALMQWLVRMVTPPGGVVLDPFAGSGTTGEAARREGFDCILLEREPEFLDDMARRFRRNAAPGEGLWAFATTDRNRT